MNFSSHSLRVYADAVTCGMQGEADDKKKR